MDQPKLADLDPASLSTTSATTGVRNASPPSLGMLRAGGATIAVTLLMMMMNYFEVEFTETEAAAFVGTLFTIGVGVRKAWANYRVKHGV